MCLSSLITELQLEVYAYAVQKIVRTKEVELALHYLVPTETVSGAMTGRSWKSSFRPGGRWPKSG